MYDTSNDMTAEFYYYLAESNRKNENYEQAIDYYNELLKLDPDEPYYYFQRGIMYRFTEEYPQAIDDMSKAIILDPDCSEYRQKRAATTSHYLSKVELNTAVKMEYLKNVEEDYRASLERDPTEIETTLGLLEIMLITHQFDNAVAFLGQCVQKVGNDRQKQILSWLGCIALIFAGEPIEKEDIAPLLDKNMKLSRLDWCVAEIDAFLEQPELKTKFPVKTIKMANKIHDQFLDKFTTDPMRGRVT